MGKDDSMSSIRNTPVNKERKIIRPAELVICPATLKKYADIYPRDDESLLKLVKLSSIIEAAIKEGDTMQNYSKSACEAVPHTPDEDRRVNKFHKLLFDRIYAYKSNPPARIKATLDYFLTLLGVTLPERPVYVPLYMRRIIEQFPSMLEYEDHTRNHFHLSLLDDSLKAFGVFKDDILSCYQRDSRWGDLVLMNLEGEPLLCHTINSHGSTERFTAAPLMSDKHLVLRLNGESSILTSISSIYPTTIQSETLRYYVNFPVEKEGVR
jgi:hypothetical protein